MSSRGSIPVRLVALGGALVLIVAIAAVLMSRSGESSAAPPVAVTTSTGATTPAATTSNPAAAKSTAKKKPAQQPRPALKKRSSAVVGVAAIEAALKRAPVVVVAAVQPAPVVDRETAREAKAGADTAGVPYVELDVLDELQARQLFKLLDQTDALSAMEAPPAIPPAATSETTTTTTVPTTAAPLQELPSTPQVMIFKRPRKIALSFSGYVDRQIVAQAAAAASGRPSGEAWQKQANTICAANDQRLSRLPTSQFTGSTSDIQLVRKAIAMVRGMTADLARVHVPATRASQYRHTLSLANDVLTQLENLLAAYQHGQGPELVKAYLRLDQISADVVEGFVALGLTSCI